MSKHNRKHHNYREPEPDLTAMIRGEDTSEPEVSVSAEVTPEVAPLFPGPLQRGKPFHTLSWRINSWVLS